MNVDLTPAEISRLILLLEAQGQMQAMLDQTVHRKLLACVANVKPENYTEDPAAAAAKWQVTKI